MLLVCALRSLFELLNARDKLLTTALKSLVMFLCLNMLVIFLIYCVFRQTLLLSKIVSPCFSWLLQ